MPLAAKRRIWSLRRRCHAARPPRRATARPSAKNTLRLRRNCFFACGSRCFPAPGRSALLCRGGLVAARGRVWAPAPTSLYFLPSRIATHQGGPACPFKAIYLLSASAPWAGTSPAPTPRLQGVSSSSSVFFVQSVVGLPIPLGLLCLFQALIGIGTDVVCLGVPWIQLDGLVTACDRLAVSLQSVEDSPHICMIECPICTSLTAFR
mgnify:CR=1 FL=1